MLYYCRMHWNVNGRSTDGHQLLRVMEIISPPRPLLCRLQYPGYSWRWLPSSVPAAVSTRILGHSWWRHAALHTHTHAYTNTHMYKYTQSYALNKTSTYTPLQTPLHTHTTHACAHGWGVSRMPWQWGKRRGWSHFPNKEIIFSMRLVCGLVNVAAKRTQ